MAYAALDSLAKTLDRVLDHRCFKSSDGDLKKKDEEKKSSDDGERRRCLGRFFLRKKLQIQFLHEKKLDRVLDHRCFKSSDDEALKKKKEKKKSSDDGERRRCIGCFFLRKKLQIQFLHEKVVLLSSFLEDFPREAANLEARLSNAAKQVESVFKIDYFASKKIEFDTALEARLSNAAKQVRRLDTADENDRMWKRFCQELEESTEEMDSVFQEAMQIKSSSKTHSSTSIFPPKLDTIAKEAIVGFEEVLMEIKGRLCGEPSSHLEIIPIVGMGGIGKTTLARHSYQDPSTAHHFDVRAWVTVSQNSSAEIILSSLLSSIDPSYKEYHRHMSTELLLLHGYRYLKSRRYLIVMDDMWDTNLWDEVRMAFPDDCNGSRIIITTRDSDVASYVDYSNKPHNIQLMSVDQSWRLLNEVVFGQENCLPELEKIGKHIAEKCRGLPLAIVVIAGVLSKLQKKQDSWEKIARNVSEAVNTSSDKQFSDILSVSYMHLPPHLRPCFLYMACFPEDYEINVATLIRLWIAEGFLISNESKDMEELGYEYLEDLARRSLVLIEKKRYDGKIKTVRIHDVLRDLCIRKSRNENFHHIINEFEGNFPQGIENSNRISIFCNVSGLIPNMESSPTYTILLFKNWAFDSWKSFRLLRVVHGLSITFSSCRSNAIRFIGELIHLRYLALACEPIRRTLRLVSESLFQLQNLQTLIVKVLRDAEIHFFSLDDEDLNQWYMKFEISRMPQLRHLILLDGFLPDLSTESCLEISALKNLQTLSRMQDFNCTERVLEMIPNLKKLGIVYTYAGTYATGWSSYSLNNLVHLHKLEKLSFYAEPYLNIKNDVLSKSISFPVTLKKLTLSGCRFPWEDMRMIGSLPSLEVLKLMRHACDGTEWETNEGEFCQLKVLLIDSTDLHQWISDDSSFPMLERLTLYECGSLREVPNGIGDIPTLQLIEVDIRDLSVVESAKCIEEQQQSFGNDPLQVRFLKSRAWDARKSRH